MNRNRKIQLNNRREKINFLNGILQGKNFVSELTPVKIVVYMVSKCLPPTHRNTSTGKIFTEQERERMRGNRTVIKISNQSKLQNELKPI